MTESGNNSPYKDLGIRLKQMRDKLQETLAEVSGAVEIELDDLNRIEQGKLRPSEDILLLLISHFDLKEEEATKLWEMANYEQNSLPGGKEYPEMTSITLMVQPELRIVYTDAASVNTNNGGVVINFMQDGLNGQPIAISRIGMSKESARSLAEVLNRSLEADKPKLITARKTRTKRSGKRTR